MLVQAIQSIHSDNFLSIWKTAEKFGVSERTIGRQLKNPRRIHSARNHTKDSLFAMNAG